MMQVAESEADFRVEQEKRASMMVNTSLQRAQSDLRIQRTPSAGDVATAPAPAPIAAAPPKAAPVAVAAGLDMGSLFVSAIVRVRDVLQLSRTRLHGDVYQYVRGRKAASDCYEIYREQLGRTRRHLSESTLWL